MAGGTVAALLGLLLARWTQDLFAPVMFAGCFAAIALLGGLICLALGFLDPLRPRRQGSAGSGRPLAAIARQPAAVTAFLTALVAYVTMNLLMTATPLAMLACGFGFAESATVIQWHVLGMFAPSFVTGHLIARFGVMRVIAAESLMAACVGVDLLGVEVVHFAAGLLLLGVGWNFMFIGATALLTSCYTEAEKTKVQGLNDFLIFTTVAVSASSAGALHHLLGWQAMNLLAVPGLLLVAANPVPRRARDVGPAGSARRQSVRRVGRPPRCASPPRRRSAPRSRRNARRPDARRRRPGAAGAGRHDLVVPHVRPVELVQPRAVEGGAEIEVVGAWGAADQPDLGQERPGAAVGAAGHADHDLVPAQARLVQRPLQRVDQAGQVALALGQRQAAGRQRHAGHGVEAQARAVVAEPVLAQQRLDPLPVPLDPGDDQVLVRRELELALVASAIRRRPVRIGRSGVSSTRPFSTNSV